MAAILADDIFKCIFSNENDGIPIQISLKLILMCPIDNNPALLQLMARHRKGDKPLFVPVHWRIYAALGGAVDLFYAIWLIRVFMVGFNNVVLIL